jgi:Tfp pilus assembly protein PilN
VRAPLIDQLDALPVPGDDRDQVKGWIAGLRIRTAVLTRLAAAYAAQRQADVARLSEREDALAQRGAAFAEVYGMPRCAAAP